MDLPLELATLPVHTRKVLEVKIPGDPVPARREARGSGRFAKVVWSDAYKAWKRHAIAFLIRELGPRRPHKLLGVFGLDLVAVFPRPLRKPRPEVDNLRIRYPWTWGPGRNPYVGIPDWDNLAKGPGDSLVGAQILQDDRWIVSGSVEQWYGAPGEHAHMHMVLYQFAEDPCSSD